ncbi:MAG: hypothetical protein AB7N73_06615 [Gemmatimonadales bacterium]
MPDRRYSDEEVAEIFRRATAEVPPQTAGSTGMSLQQLQEIGREVGLTPEAVTEAARSLDRAAPTTTTTRLLGLPIGVADGVVLPRRLRDDEWDALVVAARDTFGARGALRSDGGFRQWTNSNLLVLLEPAGEGHRLRLRTLNGHARRMIFGGLGALGVAAVVTAVPILSGNPELFSNLDGMATLAVVGALLLGRGIWGLRAWAARRQAQFRDLADRATRMTQPE